MDWIFGSAHDEDPMWFDSDFICCGLCFPGWKASQNDCHVTVYNDCLIVRLFYLFVAYLRTLSVTQTTVGCRFSHRWLWRVPCSGIRTTRRSASQDVALHIPSNGSVIGELERIRKKVSVVVPSLFCREGLRKTMKNVTRQSVSGSRFESGMSSECEAGTVAMGMRCRRCLTSNKWPNQLIPICVLLLGVFFGCEVTCVHTPSWVLCFNSRPEWSLLVRYWVWTNVVLLVIINFCNLK
jgi:hypothetical protein